MRVSEFKLAYPQYSHLEGDQLWDKMTEVFLSTNGVLIADPKQKKVFLPSLDIGGINVSIEDSSTTRWLNDKGELVRIGEEPYLGDGNHTSYRMEIIDFSKNGE